jgi:hypothetical protein
MRVNLIQQPRASSAFRWIAILCLLLVSLFSTAQAFHFHADPLDGAAKECSVCQALHGTAVAVQSVQINYSFHTLAYLPANCVIEHRSLSTPFALFSRPPPSA